MDITEATFSSFISQECDSDVKYSFDMARLPKIFQKTYERFPSKFDKGFFNIKVLQGNAEIRLQNMTKYCFEPYKMTVREAMSIGPFNRSTRSTLFASEYEKKMEKHIAGITIVIDIQHTLMAIYFAVPSSGVGYKYVYYRRWRGEGFEEFL